MPVEIEILDSQFQALAEPQPRTVEQRRYESHRAMELTKYRPNLVARKNDGLTTAGVPSPRLRTSRPARAAGDSAGPLRLDPCHPRNSWLQSVANVSAGSVASRRRRRRSA